MFIYEQWDGIDAPVLGIAACVVCGDYVDEGDLCGYVSWSDGRMTPVFAYHVGRHPCRGSQRIEAAAVALEGSLGDFHVRDYMDYVARNLASHPKADGEDLTRRQRRRVDLTRFGAVLEHVGSPLLTVDETT